MSLVIAMFSPAPRPALAADPCVEGLVAATWYHDAAVESCNNRSKKAKDCMEKFIELAVPPAPVAKIFNLCNAINEDYAGCLTRFAENKAPFNKPIGDTKLEWTLQRVTEYCESRSDASRECLANSDNAPLNTACLIRNIYEKGCPETLMTYDLTQSFSDRICKLKTIDMQACVIKRGMDYFMSRQKNLQDEERKKKEASDPNHKASFGDIIDNYSKFFETMSRIGKSAEELKREEEQKRSGDRKRADLDPEDRITLNCLIELQKKLPETSDGTIKLKCRNCP